ncbi:MAG: LrgB family protein [Parabacteroides sp.]|uniref:LrgB family protein n=1 Tax=Parabacteroides faecalis TaxID=2924040 RepID=A0ABT0C1E7_9BACT|nr:LrgB family protein [Parabacteroides faecalis]MCI7286697.1 LrgB family protein [Parabacteroides sp.]MDY6253396.1 LrgB family protein [Bacteroidales bacterium]MCJ2380814.1 LrgB family protein [Parabacteroides faecalis]MDD6950071.1 LrgB family protein [Parabacteroides sp.]MDD7560404.1 LrgB family protein [Parabacteroides sp.]
MHSLVHSEIFDLALVVGTYIAATILYKKTHLSILHPLLTSIFVIIVILEFLDIEYASFQQGSHLIHFMLGPSVVALGYVLFEQMKYLKGNVVSILTSVFVGAIVGIISVIVIGKLMGADQSLIATLQPKSVTTPIAMGISEKNGGIPSLTAVIVVAVGIFGSIVGPAVMKVLGIESRIAKGLALGASSHGVGTAAAIQLGAVEGALSGLAIGLMGIMTAILVPVISYLLSLFA